MSEINCYWLEPINAAKRSLRRFVFSTQQEEVCPGPMGYHNASNPLDDIYIEAKTTIQAGMWPRGDRRWPKTCAACGYRFNRRDQWQLDIEPVFRRSDNGDLITLRQATPGAMWDAWWLRGSSRYKERPDGLCIICKTPGGDWCLDGPSSNGNGWERSGTPPNITANPSILAGTYHGWLRDGKLIEC